MRVARASASREARRGGSTSAYLGQSRGISRLNLGESRGGLGRRLVRHNDGRLAEAEWARRLVRSRAGVEWVGDGGVCVCVCVCR